MFVAFLAFLPPIFLRNAYGVYLSAALFIIYYLGSATAWNPILYGLPSPENRAGHFTIQLLAYNTVSSIGALLAGFLCDSLSYRTVFILGAAISLALYPVVKKGCEAFKDKAEEYS